MTYIITTLNHRFQIIRFDFNIICNYIIVVLQVYILIVNWKSLCYGRPWDCFNDKVVTTLHYGQRYEIIVNQKHNPRNYRIQ